MSLFSVQTRKHTAYYDHLMSTSTSRGGLQEGKITDKTMSRSEVTSGGSVCDDSRWSDRSRQINRTYVISALSKSGVGPQTPRGRLTLQRRSKRRTGAETAEETATESSQNTGTPVPEKRLTLQRRTRTPSMDKGAQVQRGVGGTGPHPTPNILSEPNGRTPGVYRSISLRETKTKGAQSAVNVEPNGRSAPGQTPLSSSTGRPLEEQAQTFKTPTRKTPFEKIAARREVFERLTGKEAAKPVKPSTIVRSKSRVQQTEDAKPVPAPRISRPGVHKRPTSSSDPKAEAARTSTPAPAAPTEHVVSRPSKVFQPPDPLKMENSALTVAVRVRPFNPRFVLSFKR